MPTFTPPVDGKLAETGRVPALGGIDLVHAVEIAEERIVRNVPEMRRILFGSAYATSGERLERLRGCGRVVGGDHDGAEVADRSNLLAEAERAGQCS